MLKKHRQVSIEKLRLTNPQREGVLQLLASQKNKYRKLLHEAHERLHILADMTSSLEFWQNIDGHFEHISPVCEKMTGYVPSEFFNDEVRIEDIIHPDSRRQFTRDKKKAVAGRSGTDVEYKFLRKDAQVRWALTSWQPVVTRRGRQIGVRISIRDITAQKLFQELATNYETAFRALVSEAQAVAVISLDPTGAVLSWNAVAERLSGISEREVVGAGFLGMLDGAGREDGERLLDALRVFPPEPHATFHAALKRSDATQLPVRITFTALYDSDQEVSEVLCFFHAASVETA